MKSKKEKKPTQKERIIRYMQLRHGQWISPMDAIYQLNCYKLSTRVGELVRNGHKIERETYYYHNVFGEKSHYTRYRLVG